MSFLVDHAILFTGIRSFFCVSVKMLRQYVIGEYTKEIKKLNLLQVTTVKIMNKLKIPNILIYHRENLVFTKQMLSSLAVINKSLQKSLSHLIVMSRLKFWTRKRLVKRLLQRFRQRFRQRFLQRFRQRFRQQKRLVVLQTEGKIIRKDQQKLSAITSEWAIPAIMIIPVILVDSEIFWLQGPRQQQQLRKRPKLRRRPKLHYH